MRPERLVKNILGIKEPPAMIVDYLVWLLEEKIRPQEIYTDIETRKDLASGNKRATMIREFLYHRDSTWGRIFDLSGEEVSFPTEDVMRESEFRHPQAPFLETGLNPVLPPWCIDGQPDLERPKGAQMLGGSLHPVLLHALFTGKKFNSHLLGGDFSILTDAHYGLGVHRGSHASSADGVSDCGFADRLDDILAKVTTEQAEITRRLLVVFCKNPSAFSYPTIDSFIRNVTSAFAVITKYSLGKIKLQGEALITKTIELGASAGNVTGDHQELVAYVNIKPAVTLATNRLNMQGHQAFNLDLLVAVAQAEALGVPKGFTQAASLILYQATEMVLVEDKGKPRLEVRIHQ